ncbi:MAG: regulatory protein RecX [Phycisphaeraceae bacterium]
MVDQRSLFSTGPDDEPASPRRTPLNKAAKTSPFDRAFKQAMQRLNRRAMSAWQLATKLGELKHDEAIVAQVIERLKRIGALDDEKLARGLIEEVTRKGPAGAALLRKKLARFGFEESLVDRVVNDAASAASPVDEARALVAKKLPSLMRFPAATRLRRLASLLARRGMDEETIESVLSEMET